MNNSVAVLSAACAAKGFVEGGLRKVAAELDIDQSLLSKIERGERKATRDQIIQIARIFEADENELIINYLSDKVIYELADEALATEALKVAEKKIKYLTKNGNDRL